MTTGGPYGIRTHLIFFRDREVRTPSSPTDRKNYGYANPSAYVNRHLNFSIPGSYVWSLHHKKLSVVILVWKVLIITSLRLVMIICSFNQQKPYLHINLKNKYRLISLEDFAFNYPFTTVCQLWAPKILNFLPLIQPIGIDCDFKIFLFCFNSGL